ncbi:MAG: cadmium-translocating P-type ATPase [Ruminococcaceae bacterium]|nr:cadmium-translocating P-type ATPase [Oscillospiraceae bacterium]
MSKKQKKLLIRIVVAACLILLLEFVKTQGTVRFILYLIPYLVIGYDILKKAAKGIMNGQVFDENFLMAVATIGAMVIALTDTGDYVEAVAVLLFYQTGELFQSCAVEKSRRSISRLMDIRPDYANIELHGELIQVDPDEVEIGSVIIVLPGEKVPVDGIVVEGSSDLNCSALTGESLPTDVEVGDEVISGSVNMTGVLRIKTTKEFGESTVSKILELVENAGSRKAKTEKFISRFARIYTPAVCFAALALAILPPMFRTLILGISADWNDWIYRALTFLVISCPCALVISIPLSFFAGIGGAGNVGILIKGANYLEALAGTEVVVFDKTGTLTKGAFEVSAVHSLTMEEKKLLEYTALAESASSHPISKSIRDSYDGFVDRTRVTDICEISGEGVTAIVDGREVVVGNSRLMARYGVEYPECDTAGTIVHIAVDRAYAGNIIVFDSLKDNAERAVAQLKKSVSKTVMLTGDIEIVASKVAAELGIDEVYSRLLPGDKVDIVEKLIANKPSKSKLAFVGDGINDAPALSRADIGVAMGAMGSDAAIEAADVVLMDDDPMKVVKAVMIAKKCMRIVYQNTVLAVGIKAICLVLGAIGSTDLWLAIFADVGVMIIAVLNSIRALFVKNL